MKKMNLLIQIIAVSMIAVSAQAEECVISEVKAFSEEVVPAEGWVKADGRLLGIAEYSPLFSLIENKYGGSVSKLSMGVPQIDDLVINGHKYNYYICVKGIFPGVYGPFDIGFLRQMAANVPGEFQKRMASVSSESLAVPWVDEMRTLFNQDLVEDGHLWIPQVVMPEQIRNEAYGGEGLTSFLTVSGVVNSDRIPDCEKGALYFSLSPYDNPRNATEIFPDAGDIVHVSLKGQRKTSTRIFVCN